MASLSHERQFLDSRPNPELTQKMDTTVRQIRGQRTTENISDPPGLFKQDEAHPDDSDIQNFTSAPKSYPPQYVRGYMLAIEELAAFFQQDVGLATLFRAAISAVGLERFERNIANLLANYSRNLSKEASPGLQYNAAILVRRFRHQTAKRIGVQMNDNAHMHSETQEAQMSQWATLPLHLSHNPETLETSAHFTSEKVRQIEDFHVADYDGSDSDDSQDPKNLSAPPINILKGTKDFLKSAQAMQILRAEFRQWLVINEEGQAGQDNPEVGHEENAQPVPYSEASDENAEGIESSEGMALCMDKGRQSPNAIHPEIPNSHQSEPLESKAATELDTPPEFLEATEKSVARPRPNDTQSHLMGSRDGLPPSDSAPGKHRQRSQSFGGYEVNYTPQAPRRPLLRSRSHSYDSAGSQELPATVSGNSKSGEATSVEKDMITAEDDHNISTSGDGQIGSNDGLPGGRHCATVVYGVQTRDLATQHHIETRDPAMRKQVAMGDSATQLSGRDRHLDKEAITASTSQTNDTAAIYDSYEEEFQLISCNNLITLYLSNSNYCLLMTDQITKLFRKSLMVS